MGYFDILFTSSGYTGSPGYTKFHFIASETVAPSVTDVNNAAAACRALLQAFASNTPTGINYSFVNPAQWKSNTGQLLGEVAATTIPNPVTGSATALWPGGAGAVLQWETGALNGGHRVRGRTFIVPLANSAFSSDGTIVGTLITSATNAISAYLASSPAPAVNTRDLGKPGRGNATYVIQSGVIKDRSAFLRSRRT